MHYPVDLSLFTNTKHSPTLPRLQRSLMENGMENAQLRDYCIPVNPYFPTQNMMNTFHKELETLMKYYPDAASSHTTLARLLNVPENSLVLANGSTELITWMDHLYIEESLATTIPTFGRWTDQPNETGKTLHLLQRREEANFRLSAEETIRFVESSGARAVAICNPNNPAECGQFKIEFIWKTPCESFRFWKCFLTMRILTSYAWMQGYPELSCGTTC